MFLSVVEQEIVRRNALPDNFAFFSWKVLQDEPEIVEIKGGEFRLLKSGKRKGRKCWKGRNKANDRAFYVTADMAAEYTRAWVERNGKCPRCEGSRETLASCGVKPEGGVYSTYRTCSLCNGSGLPVEAVANA